MTQFLQCVDEDVVNVKSVNSLTAVNVTTVRI